MKPASSYLAIDLGASGGRLLLGRLADDRLQLQEVHRFANGPVRLLDGLHWDVLRLFEEVRSGLAKCAAEQPQLDAIGIDTWGVDYGLLSPGGELLGVPRHYRDPRNRVAMDETLRRVPRADIYARTGIQFMPFNTIYQLVAERRAGGLLDAAGTLLFMPDLMNYFLTGVARSEYTIASTSQLYDTTARCWDAELLRRLDIPARIMPPVAEPATEVGALRDDIARECGLSPTRVVAPGSHDTASAVTAVPAEGENWAYISSGTWSPMGLELPRAIKTPDSLAANFTNEGGICGTVRFLTNVAGLWLLQECQRTWAGQGEAVDAMQFAALAQGAAPFAALIEPDDPVFADPGDMPARIRAWCTRSRQPPPQSKGQLIRCIMESLALKYRTVIETAQRLGNRPIDVIHIVGGGSRNGLLNQWVADATGRRVVAGPHEATAIGNLLAQGMARGAIRSREHGRRIIANSFPLERHEPGDRGPWDRAAARIPEYRSALAAAGWDES
ncbi:MAG: L-Rhamnulokinase [Phycisphaerae bacterium]|nr:L-Rhamnulokinase [Phycisphaerae bacterium]